MRGRERFGGRDDAALGAELIDPVLGALGFTPAAANGADAPDLWLTVGGGDRVACLVYPWDRYLDGRDETRDPQRAADTPGARVVSVLQGSDAGWAIVTNGKLWRLYSGAAHSTATNYYEIDLEETLAASDPNEAFRYFWLLFRAAAFSAGTDGKSFVERLVGESEAFATSLGEQLKSRVFDEIFPRLAEGFMAHRRASVPEATVSQEVLDETFRATLTLLYRLLFILFAEARDLLPVREAHGYAGRSLQRLKRELADRAGTLADQREARLQHAYGSAPNATGLYDAVLALSRAIDRGDPSANLPLYDGGLFLTEPDPADDSPEAAAARFLATQRVPDAQMAVALDLLARDIDPKRGDLVFIDYKSLGVRHLGSIYEGLLEFKLRVARERMAIVRGKRTEEVVPYAQAVHERRTILRDGRGRNAPERVLEAGAVYLENDKRERKASGSYYTPDHIVQYIVREAVGPALEAHLEGLRPRMREAQQAYRQAVGRVVAFQKQGMRGDDPAKVANDPRWIALADEVFDFHVLDPAMGSGHFLVETVDFVTDRLLVFLNGFPWNPVEAALRRTRETIQSEMERQGVTVDATKLNDLNLLKRQVLKRCIYGVDLNPMAVELAKVSLWLDCFTLGAPLSFLDHHLKCGNSLIGVTIGDVEEALRVQHGEHYGTLFGGTEFAGVMSAVEMMKIVGGLSDVTPSQVAESRGQYRKASDELAPFKETLDIFISRWFGNRPTKTKGRPYDPTLEFLRTPDSRSWLKDPSRIGRVGLTHRKVREIAQAAIRQHRFFHWQLEFPEVFFGASAASQQVVELKSDGGFDAVIGNPPYDVLASEELRYDVSDLAGFLGDLAEYVPAIRGKNNLYKLFICRGFRLRRPTGGFSFIVPMALLGDDQSAGVRRMLLEANVLRRVEAFPQKDDASNRVFPEAKLSTAVFVGGPAADGQAISVYTHPGRQIEENSSALCITAEEVRRLDAENLPLPTCSARDWGIASAILAAPRVRRLGDYVTAAQGEINETTDSKGGYVSKEPSAGPAVLRGSNICLYVVREASQGAPIYLRREAYLRGKPASAKAHHHEDSRIAWQESSPQNNFRRIIAAKVPTGEFCNHKINYIPERDARLPLDLCLALLNSRLCDWFFRLTSSNAAVSHYQVHNLPAPDFETHDVHDSAVVLRADTDWEAFTGELKAKITEPCVMPARVGHALCAMADALQAIEAERVLTARSDRSHLAPESQPIQDAIDAVLFRCYGVSDDDARYIERRLGEML